MPPTLRQKLLNDEQAGQALQVSRTTLWRLRRSGALPFYRLGGKVLYDNVELMGWLKQQRGRASVLASAPAYDIERPLRAREERWKKAIESRDWSFHDESTNELTHALHPYPAKFPPQIPATLIEILTRPGAVVLDPFCGSGTTLVEALRLDRCGVGTDVNPVAVLASEAKTLRLCSETRNVLASISEAIDADMARERGEPALFSDRWPECVPTPPPNIPNRQRWFSHNASRELGIILSRIEAMTDACARTAARATLSSILVSVSNQDSETRYTAREKSLPKGATLALFLRRLAESMKQLETFRAVAPNRTAVVLQADARTLPKKLIGRVDAVVTSPPYANAFDYHLYHRHRMYWLGHDPSEMRDTEIGSHLNYQRRGEGIGTYRRDMVACFLSLHALLKTGSPLAFVVGDSVFLGEVVDNAGVLIGAAQETGYRCLAVVERRIHPVKRSMIKAARRARIERIVLLVKR